MIKKKSPCRAPYLIFSSWFTVSRMDLDGSNYEVLVDSAANVGPHAVDYHWRYNYTTTCSYINMSQVFSITFLYRLNLLFWGHYRDGTINQALLTGSNASVIANVNTPSKCIKVTKQAIFHIANV